jgi:cytochrome c oxidase subunit 2
MINKWLGIVPNASAHGVGIDHMLELCHWFMLVLFVGWFTFFVVSIYKFRASRNPTASYKGVTSHYSTHAEVGVIIVEAVLLVGLAFPLWGKRVLDFPSGEQGNVIRVRGIAEQYAWNFHYAGGDGQFGAQDVGAVTSANPLGIHMEAAEGKDDIVVKNELHVVVQKPVVLEVSSKDVIHAFAVHHMRVAQDAIPGTKVPIWFRPVRSGRYEIACGQLCGGGHYAMRAFLVVEAQEEFDKFYKEFHGMQHPGGAQ